MRFRPPVSEVSADRLEEWRRTLTEVASRSHLLPRAMVVASVGSTMDLAREVDPGTFVVALEQTAGRGRRGRPWFDGGGGVAATAVLEFEGEASLLPTRAGVAMATAVEPWLGGLAGLKWPNDLMVGGRKLGGVLVERSGARVHVGVGLNVEAIDRPTELDGVATSLGELLETPPTRLQVACELSSTLGSAMTCSEDEIRRAWRGRDCLRGRTIRVLDGRRARSGRVLDIEPDRHLDLSTGDGEVVRVPLATARIDMVIDPDKGTGPVGRTDPNRR